LQLNRNRFYHSGLGRWVNRDPIGYADGYNLYAAYFVPNETDPFGKSIAGRILCDCFELLIHPFGFGPIIAAAAARDCQQKGWDRANANYPQGSVEHRAMRHCVASGCLATKGFVKCSGAECIGTAREDAQEDENGQDPREGQRGKNNNALGRTCAGCTGKNADKGGKQNKSSQDIANCCKKNIDNGDADLDP